jgi:hypothetical protein
MTNAPTHKVFVTQIDPKNPYDMSSLGDVGEVVPLFGRSLYPDEADERSAAMLRIARAKLSGFNPDTDYLALSGDPVSVAVAVAVLSGRVRDLGKDKFVSLKWDRVNRGYYEVPVWV